MVLIRQQISMLMPLLLGTFDHLQSNLNGSNIFGTMEIRSRHG